MFIIYGKESCIFCDKAKALLKLRGLEYSYRDINVGAHWEDMKTFFPEARTVPQIVFDRRDGNYDFIGSYNDLQEYLKNE